MSGPCLYLVGCHFHKKLQQRESVFASPEFFRQDHSPYLRECEIHKRCMLVRVLIDHTVNRPQASCNKDVLRFIEAALRPRRFHVERPTLRTESGFLREFPLCACERGFTIFNVASHECDPRHGVFGCAESYQPHTSIIRDRPHGYAGSLVDPLITEIGVK